MSDVITKAAQFAKAAHESIDQRRKYSNLPYIVHPTAVAATVSSVTNDPATIAAAWLHDVVEDTPIRIEDVEREFGADIAKLVSDLTDISQPADGNRRRRKAIDRQHSAQTDARAKTVKLADIIDNLSDITEIAPKSAAKYLKEKELLLQVLGDGDARLYRRAEALIREELGRLKRRSSRGQKK